MTPCHVVQFTTPKGYLLNGLWFGPKKPKRAIVWVHGLGSTMFSKLGIAEMLAKGDTAVLMFNNRGHDVISRLSRRGKKKTSILGGTAHEVFTDSLDDIQGAVNFARRQRGKQVFLAGHSTGCQKSVFWASKKKTTGVEGIILLAPVDDWSAERKLRGKKKLERAVAVARALVRAGKKSALLPAGVWYEVLDAQRFLSLYTPDSVESMFCYTQSDKRPKILESVRLPILMLWAERDEFSSLPAKKVQDWFAEHLKVGDKIAIIPRVGHGFKGGEKRVAGEIRRFIREV